jgi:ECF sigma factor
LVYEGLRKLAAAKMAHEAPGHTLQATALVHEAWLRLIGDGTSRWQGPSHFFAAAAQYRNACAGMPFWHNGSPWNFGICGISWRWLKR